jgi:hypothetical protein
MGTIAHDNISFIFFNPEVIGFERRDPTIALSPNISLAISTSIPTHVLQISRYL